MPTLTSRPTPPGHPASVAPETEAVVFASKLPLRSRLTVPGFMRDTMRIKRQLDALYEGNGDGDGEGGGLLWYALRADLVPNEYWTVSAWRSDAALTAFVRAEPHAGIMRHRRGSLTGFESARWTVPASELPIAHDEIVARIG